MDDQAFAEIIKYLGTISPPLALIATAIYAFRKFPDWLLKKMEIDCADKDRIMVQLKNRIMELTAELDKLKKDIGDYRKSFSSLQDQHEKLKQDYDKLKSAKPLDQSAASQTLKKTAGKK